MKPLPLVQTPMYKKMRISEKAMFLSISMNKEKQSFSLYVEVYHNNLKPAFVISNIKGRRSYHFLLSFINKRRFQAIENTWPCFWRTFRPQ